MIFIDFLGWAGVVSVLLAYWLAASGRVPSDSFKSSLINIFGGIAIGVAAFFHASWHNVGLEIIFVSIAVKTFLKSIR